MARKIKNKLKQPLTYRGKVASVKVKEYHDSNNKFKPGNPGKPVGAISARTKLQNLLMSAFGPKEVKVFAEFFKKADGNYLQALDRLIEAINGGKDLSALGAEGLPPLILNIEPDDDE